MWSCIVVVRAWKRTNYIKVPHLDWKIDGNNSLELFKVNNTVSHLINNRANLRFRSALGVGLVCLKRPTILIANWIITQDPLLSSSYKAVQKRRFISISMVLPSGFKNLVFFFSGVLFFISLIIFVHLSFWSNFVLLVDILSLLFLIRFHIPGWI